MAGSRAPAVKARELRVSYRGRRSLRRREAPIEALRGLDLEVAGGEIHGLLGPNGAGKTTLCRISAARSRRWSHRGATSPTRTAW